MEPDPDDYETEAEYLKAYDLWAGKQKPEILQQETPADTTGTGEPEEL